jgi:hypothetical protein
MAFVLRAMSGIRPARLDRFNERDGLKEGLANPATGGEGR